MDDISAGADTESELMALMERVHKVMALMEKVHNVLQERGFFLHKYSTNSQQFWRILSPELCNANQSQVDLYGDSHTSVLGLI